MAVEVDARILVARYIDKIKEKLSDAIQGGRDRLPRMDIFITDGSSKQFIKSIRNKCSSLGIVLVEHEISLDIDRDSLTSELIKLVDSGDSDGIIFIRPSYNPSIEISLKEVNKVFEDSLPERYDIDRIGFEEYESYPPVAQAVKDILDYAEWMAYASPKYSRTVMIGLSPYVGVPISKLLVSMCNERVVRHSAHHESGNPKLISFDTEEADIICTYRDIDDLKLNPYSFVVDVGNGRLIDKIGDRAKYCTSHLGQLTTAILIMNLVDSYISD